MKHWKHSGQDNLDLIKKIPDSSSIIQRKTGLVLSLLLAIISLLNFIMGITNFQETITESITNMTFLFTVSSSILMLITGIIIARVVCAAQVIIIFIAGFSTILLTVPDSLTGEFILIFGMALTYQYGYFSSFFYPKMLSIFAIYIFTTFSNVILINQLNLPLGIPSILFSLTTIYLFWMVFREEINIYLIRTNQLSRKLDNASSENIRLGLITADQAILIEGKNRFLEENLKEKTEIEKELRSTLKVKDVLLQEVHHRVKNNLTVINSLLNLQRSDVNNDVINDFIEKNSNRLYAMAAVHEIIHQGEVSGSVNIADYFTDITQNLIKIYSENKDLQIDVFAEYIEVSIDIAVFLGIILNDCIANSITYGFNNYTANKIISINIKKMREIEITISDNGNQFPISVKNADKDEFFSIWLIKILVEEQLQGSIKTNYDDGNIWIIRLPYEKNQNL